MPANGLEFVDRIVFVEDFGELLHVVLVGHLGEFLVHHKFIDGFMHRLTSDAFNAQIYRGLLKSVRLVA